MKSEFQEKLEADTKVIEEAVKLQMPIVITSYTLPKNMEIYIREVTSLFLKECRQEHLFEYLDFCLTELLTNAKKANTKRVYFLEKNLDINNPDDYKIGMENFKEETLTNIDYYLELQKKAGLYVKLQLQLKGDKIHIEIRNNSLLTKEENEKIHEKLASVQKYTSLEDAYANVLDQSEGAGLGIIIIILMLEEVGLDKNSYQVFIDENETVTSLVLPCNEKIFGGTDMLSYQFVRLQDSIPCFEESFNALQECLYNENSSRRDILNHIAFAPMLTMVLFKNSFEKGCPELNLLKIFDIFSREDLKKIFSKENPDIQIIQVDDETKSVLTHSKKVGFFVYNLTKNYKDNLLLSPEQMYSLGLLNSFGMIILKTENEEQKIYVDDLLKNYDIGDKIRDVFYSGMESPYLGMVYAKRIGFPEIARQTFGYWNDYEEAKQEYLPIIKLIYFAEVLQYYDEKNICFYQIDKNILKEFNIETENQFKSILQQLKNSPKP